MDARFERYIENLRTVRTLSQPKFSPDMKAKELLETIQSNAIKCFDYMKENNAILDELIFQRAPAELTSAEIASLQEFADKMFNYASSEDCGIASCWKTPASGATSLPSSAICMEKRFLSTTSMSGAATMPSTLTGRRCAAFFRRVQAILRSMSPLIRQQKATSCAVWATAGCPCRAVRRKNAPNI